MKAAAIAMILGYVLRALETVFAALSASPEIRGRVKRTRENVQRMIAEGRGPTAEELAEVEAEIVQNAQERDKVLARKAAAAPVKAPAP
jgi:hypothetical protein